MIKNLEQLRDENDIKLVTDLFEKCLGKSKDEIKQIFLDGGIEIDDECAKESYELLKGITPIEDTALASASGGEGGMTDGVDLAEANCESTNGVLPQGARREIDRAIQALEMKKAITELEVISLMIQDIIDDLKELVAGPYDKYPFKRQVTRIILRVAILPADRYKDIAMACLTEAQRITSAES